MIEQRNFFILILMLDGPKYLINYMFSFFTENKFYLKIEIVLIEDIPILSLTRVIFPMKPE